MYICWHTHQLLRIFFLEGGGDEGGIIIVSLKNLHSLTAIDVSCVLPESLCSCPVDSEEWGSWPDPGQHLPVTWHYDFPTLYCSQLDR